MEMKRTITDGVVGCMLQEGRTTLDDDDRSFIQRRARNLVGAFCQPQKRRMALFDRVVCNIGGWAAGTIQSVDEDDPEDPTGQSKLPYVVKIDQPIGRLVSVPHDANTHCRPEVCFGQKAGSLYFTLMCMPKLRRQRGQTRGKALRFAVGDRVACAVEDETGDFTQWAAGTVLTLHVSIESEAAAFDTGLDLAGDAGCVPYRVTLDSGCTVLVHRDDHLLVRDLNLQAAGPRQAADGTRCLRRLEKRQRAADGAWEDVDHYTRRVRPANAPADDDDDDDDD